MNTDLNKTLYKGYFVCFWIFVFFVGMKIIPLCLRMVVYDTFIVPSRSMEPTLLAGDKIVVNKLIFGARWYTDIDSVRSHNPKTTRLKGIRMLKHNDIVVFNNPYPYSEAKVEFKINHVFCKRIIGLPGDTVSVVDGFYRNSSTGKVLGVEQEQLKLRITCKSSLVRKLNVYPFSKFYDWSIKSLGPYYIPKKGAIITIDTVNYILYKRIIEYETNLNLEKKDSFIMLDKKHITEYMFSQNYYFMAGDNVLNSSDSRYWGVVPEDHIVGVVTYVLFSVDPRSGLFLWDRICKSVQ